MDTREVQTALVKLGYALTIDGKAGPQTRTVVQAFQRGRGLAADGIVGPQTIKALQAATAEKPIAKPSVPSVPASKGVVPADWMPAIKMLGIVCHWTAGTYEASGLARSSYHVLIDGTPKLVRGVNIALNPPSGVLKGYAAHTRGCNSGWIGVSICCMGEKFKGQVKESPFVPGPWPMKREQWDLMTAAVADLCRRYGIPVTPRTVLSHAEVQGTLGIKQAGKWDYTRLAFDPSIIGAKACGDLLRAAVAARL